MMTTAPAPETRPRHLRSIGSRVGILALAVATLMGIAAQDAPASSKNFVLVNTSADVKPAVARLKKQWLHSCRRHKTDKHMYMSVIAQRDSQDASGAYHLLVASMTCWDAGRMRLVASSGGYDPHDIAWAQTYSRQRMYTHPVVTKDGVGRLEGYWHDRTIFFEEVYSS